MQPESLPVTASELLRLLPEVTAGRDECLWFDQATVDLVWTHREGGTWDARLVVMPRMRGAVAGFGKLQVTLEGPEKATPDYSRPGHWLFRGLPFGEYRVRVQLRIDQVGRSPLQERLR